jgi:hypothetical protein
MYGKPYLTPLPMARPKLADVFYKCHLNSTPRLHQGLSIMRRIPHILHPNVGSKCLTSKHFWRVRSHVIIDFSRFPSGATGFPEEDKTGGDARNEDKTEKHVIVVGGESERKATGKIEVSKRCS